MRHRRPDTRRDDPEHPAGTAKQNANVERYNRTVRHEWLDKYLIESIEEAQDHATQWLWAYGNDRPNMGIGGITTAIKWQSSFKGADQMGNVG